MSAEGIEVMVMLCATRARRRSGRGLGRFGLLAHVRVLRVDACAAEAQSEGER